MKRRRAIFGMTVLTGTAIAGIWGGAEFYRQYHFNHDKPDIYLLDRNKDLIAALAETIIPRTDSPGAIDAGVESFIIMMIKECSDVNTQNRFLTGLNELKDYTLTKFGNTFINLKVTERESVLGYFENERMKMQGIFGKVQNRVFGKSFFTLLKELTVQGYCTSEPGATLGLAYIEIPGMYKGCISLDAGQKSWATY